MMRRLLLIGFTCLLTASGFAAIITPSVQADMASFCQNGYPKTDSPEHAACVTGYQYGNAANPICSAQFNLPVEYPAASGNFIQPKALQDACVAGWEQWKKDDKACNGNAQCQAGLRKSNQPLTSGANPADNQNLSRPGPIPNSADLTALKGEVDIDHAECGVESFFGDLLCSFSKTAAHIADASFYVLSLFLKVPPLIGGSGNDSSDIYNAWVNMRNLANVAFVFAFLVVIYSQLTGLGISNYHIKKIIPRLIVAAIMINLSFYICALLVDVANVLGATIADTMVSLTAVPEQTAQAASDGMSSWKEIIGSTMLLTGPVIAAGAAVLFLDLAAIIPILASVVIVIAVTLIMLIMRQALIIVFIIISPLAMAALILPGTRSWFDKWRKLFIPIVMLYPSVAFVYGASNIASQIISQVGYANNSVLLAVAALGIQVVPLALTPMLMKLGGGLLSRYAGVVQNSSPVGKFKQKADDYAKYRGSVRINKALNRQPGGRLRGMKNRATAPRDAMLKRKLTKQAARKNVDLVHSSAMEDAAIDQMASGDTSNLEKAKQAASLGMYDAKSDSQKLQQQMAATGDSTSLARAKAYAINKKVGMRANKVKAQALEMSRNGVSGSDLTEAALQGTLHGQQLSEIQRQAAILRIGQMGDAASVIKLMKISGQGGSEVDKNGQRINYPPLTVEQRQQLASIGQGSGSAVRKAPFITNETAMDNVRQGFVTSENFSQTVVGNSIAEDEYSAEKLTTLDGNGGSELVAAANTETSPEAINDPNLPNYDKNKPIIKQQTKQANDDLKAAAHMSINTKRTEASIAGGRDSISQLAAQHQPPSPGGGAAT